MLLITRVYLRAQKQAGILGLDDLFISLAWAVSIALSACAVIGSKHYGLDVHTWDVPPDRYVGAALLGFISQILFLTSTCATKASVLLFYRRMTKGTYSKKLLWATWIALGLTAGYFVAVLVTYCFICQPLDAYWLSYDFSYDKDFTCLDGNVLTPFVGVFSVLSDLYAVLLPCLWLHLYNPTATQQQRWSLNFIFALGTM